MVQYQEVIEPKTPVIDLDLLNLSLSKPGFTDFKLLRAQFLDKYYHDTPSDMLDCVAHMLWYLDQSEMLLKLGLTYLAKKLQVSRADAGRGTGADRIYTPQVDYLDVNQDAPSMLGLSLPNLHPVLQNTWLSAEAVRFEEVQANPGLLDLREFFVAMRTRSMLARKLAFQGQQIGIICFDHTEMNHHWHPTEVELVELFSKRFLEPLFYLSLKISEQMGSTAENMLSPAELEVVRLAATGLSYQEIALKLNKSVRTVDKQFSNARQKVKARNLIELVRYCSIAGLL